MVVDPDHELIKTGAGFKLPEKDKIRFRSTKKTSDPDPTIFLKAHTDPYFKFGSKLIFKPRSRSDQKHPDPQP